MASILLAVLARVRSSGVNDVEREAVNWLIMYWGNELKKMVGASMSVMMGSHNCLSCWRVVRAI